MSELNETTVVGSVGSTGVPVRRREDTRGACAQRRCPWGHRGGSRLQATERGLRGPHMCCQPDLRTNVCCLSHFVMEALANNTSLKTKTGVGISRDSELDDM